MTFVSAACIGERCWCGEPAAKKVGEEILFDDPMPCRHNLTAYICAAHYAELMGPWGAEQVGFPALAAAARQGGDAQQAPGETPQSGGAISAVTPNPRSSHE